MGIIAKYKFNQSTYANFIPTFNDDFTSYTITDEIDTDGFTIRTIDSDSLPTLMRFGASTQTDREKSLLEVYECNTESVTSMNGMFNNCSSLTSLDLSNFDTSNVTNMNSIFNRCQSLTSLDISNFNTSKVANMYGMFNNCQSLTSLDISNFDTSKVTDMSYMFQYCSLLTSLDVSNFDTSQVTNMGYMFRNCSSLTSLNISNFDTSKVTDMGGMFYDCQSLTSLDVSNFDTSKVTTMSSMFFNCSSLTSLNVSNFDTGQVKNMQDMFNNCSQLTSLDLSNWNTDKLTGCPAMFRDCKSLKTLNISSFNTENVIWMNNLFRNCESLTTLDISNFKTTALQNAINMFDGCKSLKTLDISNFNTENITYIDAFFASCSPENIGMIYLSSSSINILVEKLDTISSKNIWYSDAKLEDLTKKENITYKEYKMNILESDEEIELRSNGDVYDELNLLTGELTQRIDENGEILAQEIIKTINLENKPSIDWQGDTYIHLENNTLYPQLDCEVESINYYEIPKLKANTLYTLRYIGEPTQCIFGGLTYETENNMILTSGSSDNLLYFDKEVRKVVLIEGDVRDRNFDYFEGIESLGAVEIITHKTNMPIFAKGGRI